jgi:predicted dehydrogenase
MNVRAKVTDHSRLAEPAGCLNVAIVGLGWWGNTVAGTLAESQKLNVVLGVDPDRERRDEFSRTHRIPASEHLETALSRDDISGVLLCSPHSVHATQMLAAAERGKHIYCEKPFTTTSAEARLALESAAVNGVQVAIGHERRFEPPIQELQRRAKAGDLGTPLIFEGNFSQDKFLQLPPSNWRFSTDIAPVGPLSATGIHLVDLAISVLGRPVEVWARLATLATGFANGDTLSTTVAFESGATATITAVLTSPFLGRVCVMGSKGWMEVVDRSHPEESAGWDVRLALRGHAPEARFFPPHPAVRANLESFADAVTGIGRYPVSATDIQLNVDTFEAIVRSAKSGRVELV